MINQGYSLNIINIQLEKILKSKGFRKSRNLKDFLQFVVKETTGGNGDQLKQYTIATSALNRGFDFDPQKDPIVRIQAGRLRQQLANYYREEGKNDELIIGVPIGTYIPEFLSKETVSSNKLQNNKSLPLVPSISVLPFKNLSGIESNQYIADGFSEELTMALSLFKNIIVIRASKKTSDYYENQNTSGEFLKERFILDGSIRFSSAKIKVVVTLTDANNNEVLWSSDFFENYELEKVIDIQEKVAQKVATTIADVYGGVVIKKLHSETRKTTYKNIERYDAVIKFYQFQRNPIASAYEKIFDLLNETVRKYPDFGVGYAALSNLILNNYALGYFADELGLLDQGLAHAKNGVRYDPENQMTRTYLGYAYLINNELENSTQQMHYAKSLNPQSGYYVGALGWGIALAGEWEQGIADIELSYQLNPDYPKWYHLATTLYFLKEHKFDKALEEAIKFDLPGLFWDPLLKAVTHAHMGELDEAKKSLESLLRLTPDFYKRQSFYLGMYIKFEDILELVVEGLEKAGMYLKGNTNTPL
jgi:TolB-like protein